MPLLDNIEIGKRLETCRLRLQMKPTDFAIRAGIDQSQYSKIENGKLGLSDNIWDKLNETYNLDKAFSSKGFSQINTLP